MSNNRSMSSSSRPPIPDPKPIVEQLRQLGTFANATEADLMEIVTTGLLVTVPQGWSLIWERTPADKAYVVLSGEVVVRRGAEQVAQLSAGDIVGEMAILQHKLRSATVVAASPLVVLHFTSAAVERLHLELPVFRSALDRAAIEHAA